MKCQLSGVRCQVLVISRQLQVVNCKFRMMRNDEDKGFF
jgi:hypothetical protein